jgi:hypothetical protein
MLIFCNECMINFRSRTSRVGSVSTFFREAFLPQGYPESVSSDYLQYQIWDTAQAFCSSITGLLFTAFIRCLTELIGVVR